MKRTLAGLVLAAVLVVPASAAGGRDVSTTGATQADATQAQRTHGGLGVEFVIRFRNGKPRAIKRFSFHGLRTPCAEDVIFLRDRKRKMRINRRKRFRGVVGIDDLGGRVRIRGRVRRQGRLVVGTMRARGSFRHTSTGQPLTFCDSGTVGWRAKQTWLGG